MRAAVTVLLLCCALAQGAPPLHVPKRSVSLSRQFIIYCDDLSLRLGVSSFAEETKTGVLALLGTADGWKVPIVVSIRKAEANTPGEAASNVRIFQIEDTFKIEVQLTLGADPRDIRLQQQLTRAILLEIAYRDQPGAIREGRVYLEPPAWLVEGLTQLLQNREPGAHAEIFQSLIEGGKLLPLKTFLSQDYARLDATSRQLYRFYAMSFVQLLIDQPDGTLSLLAVLRALPQGEDPGVSLPARFPIFGGSDEMSEKWWALGVARLAASDRFKGFSVEETERRLTPLLSFRLKTDSGAQQTLTLGDYKIFLKNRQAKAALQRLSESLLALSANAHPLLRPAVEEYQQIAAGLARGRARKVRERLEAAEKYRQLVITRIDEIADYLNWFEVTHMSTASGAFDDYLRTARSATGARPRTDGISRYLDELASQYE